ncbi:uncharacterized protein LOC111081598 [Drosophila obscura]|uniref:uncharacterized protein LOC111081598 n=1 Tax=Drosophila obscura TaxID=7282 RepID=UPI001BB1D8BA|nr:uncharacterized protein LOC111081598 [Drosophila obscura]
MSAELDEDRRSSPSARSARSTRSGRSQRHRRSSNRSEEDDALTKFIANLYNYGIPMIAVSVLIWIVMASSDGKYIYKYMPFPNYILVVIVFLVMVLLHCVPMIAQVTLCNWMLALVVWLCTTLAVCCVLHHFSVLTLLLLLALSVLLVLLLNFSGAKCPVEFLPGGVVSSGFMMAMTLALIVLGSVQLSTGSIKVLDAFVSVLFIMLIVAIPIQAQFCHGRVEYFQVVPRVHQMVSILTLYLTSVMLFCCLCYFTMATDRHDGVPIEATTELSLSE